MKDFFFLYILPLMLIWLFLCPELFITSKYFVPAHIICSHSSNICHLEAVKLFCFSGAAPLLDPLILFLPSEFLSHSALLFSLAKKAIQFWRTTYTVYMVNCTEVSCNCTRKFKQASEPVQTDTNTFNSTYNSAGISQQVSTVRTAVYCEREPFQTPGLVNV